MLSSARSVPWAIALSVALHALVWLWVRHWASLPDLGFELTLPDSVELGFYDAPTAPQPTAAVATTAPTQAATPKAAIPADPKRTREPGQTPARLRVDPVPSPPAVAANSGAVGSFSPAGAQLALRLDLDRIRESALADDTQALLNALPDVQLLLAGSDVDPMRDLSRLFLASPDLRRSHVVMAGRYHGDESVPRQAVEHLAQTRGASAVWRRLRGFAVAPWKNADDTPRVLTLVGPNLFAITREEDLARVLSVARALARRKQPEVLSDEAAAQALVAMADHELLGFSAENAKSFVRGARSEQVPERLELSVRQSSADAIEVEAHGQFADNEQASAAKHFWDAVRERYASHPLVALIGMDVVLRDTTLAVTGDRVDVHSNLPISRARLVLSFARDALSRAAPVPALPRTDHGTAIR